MQHAGDDSKSHVLGVMTVCDSSTSLHDVNLNNLQLYTHPAASIDLAHCARFVATSHRSSGAFEQTLFALYLSAVRPVLCDIGGRKMGIPHTGRLAH